ncbi:MAG: hypothetical protein ABSA17_09250 [Rhabdochlamydiaceae bacterium]|jgi:hypothetical protein
MQPNTPKEPKVPEEKQRDLFEGQDIPFTPPPSPNTASFTLVRSEGDTAYIRIEEKKFVKKDKIQLESDDLTHSHWFHCAHCGYVELYKSFWFGVHVTGFFCEICHSSNNLEHYQEELRKKDGLPPSWIT